MSELLGRGGYHSRTDITPAVQTIYDAFAAACDEYGVDRNNEPDITADDDALVRRKVALACYAAKHDIYAGDIISATDALLVEVQLSDGPAAAEAGVVTLPVGKRIMGRFTGPVTGPLPDEAYALVGDGMQDPPYGVGLVLDNCEVSGGSEPVDTELFAGRRVIIALGTIGLRVQKYHLADTSE